MNFNHTIVFFLLLFSSAHFEMLTDDLQVCKFPVTNAVNGTPFTADFQLLHFWVYVHWDFCECLFEDKNKTKNYIECVSNFWNVLVEFLQV